MIQILRPEACCGCTACAEKCPKQCITMQPDAEGFLYPVIDQSLCIDCGLCEKVCPVLHRNEAPDPASLPVYACRNTNETIRMASSSGGVFTLLAEQVIARGGVVFGARFDSDFMVVHDSAETLEGLAPLRGSKYTQSRIGDSFRRALALLKQDREGMFVGTSCQIAGLKRFMGRRHRMSMLVIWHSRPARSRLKGRIVSTASNAATRRIVVGDVIVSCRITAAKTMANPKRSESRNPLRTICLCGDFCTTSIFGHHVMSVRHAVSRPGAT